MRARIILQSPTRSPDTIGGAVLGWSDQGAVWAEISASGAGAESSFDVIGAITSLRITIHRRDDVRAGWRVVWGTRVLRVVGVLDEGGPRIVLICEEQSP